MVYALVSKCVQSSENKCQMHIQNDTTITTVTLNTNVKKWLRAFLPLVYNLHYRQGLNLYRKWDTIASKLFSHILSLAISENPVNQPQNIFILSILRSNAMSMKASPLGWIHGRWYHPKRTFFQVSHIFILPA